MEKIPARGLFVTGTNTDVGKTYVSALIAGELRTAGYRVGVYKPVASGCINDGSYTNGQTLVSEDAVALWEAAGRPLSLETVCPQRFRAPVAPHLAAAAEGKMLDVDLARTGLAAWTGNCDIVIVEGAGGLMSPIDDQEYVADLAAEFEYPLVVVADNAVGAINQTLQTLIAADCFDEGLQVGAVVLNDVHPGANDPAADTNLEQIVTRIEGPLISRLRHGGTHFDDPIDWHELATG